MTADSQRIASAYRAKYPHLVQSGIYGSLALLRSADTRDILAAYCLHESGFDSLRSLAKGTIRRDDSAVAEFRELSPKNVSNAARLLCLAGDDSSFQDGLDLFRAANISWGPEKITERHRTMFAEALIYTGRYAEALEYVESQPWTSDTMLKRLRLGATNPFKPGTPGATSEEDWLAKLNSYINPSGTLVPLKMLDQGPTPYDRIHTDPLPPVDGPLVTIVMSSWRRTEILLHAVNSIISQSWTNWELIIVDDASGSEYMSLYDQAAELDNRIRVARKSSNRGTYSARNTAINLARGSLIAFQDSDDWSHPQRIQRQAEFLLAHPEIPACQTPCIRTDDDLSPVEPGFQPIRRNESSLMFRMSVVKRIGFFDQARKGADSEYRARIEHEYSKKVPLVGDDAMALIRLSAGSLSRNELAPGFRHPARFLYSEGFARRHRAASFAGETYVSHRSEASPHVTARMRPKQSPQSSLTADVALIADIRESTPSGPLVDSMARQLSQHGLRVAITPYIGLDTLGQRSQTLREEVFALWDASVAFPALLTEPWRVHHAVVLDPALLQFRPWGDPQWTVGSLSAIQDHYDGDGPSSTADQLWDVETCRMNSVALFGRPPQWQRMEDVLARLLSLDRA